MKRAISFLLLLVMVFATEVPSAFAATSFTDTSNRPGQTWGQTSTSTTTVTSQSGAKQVTTKNRQLGTSTNFTVWKAMTANYQHVKGNVDLTTTISVTNSYTVNTSANSTYPGEYGISLGYTYSKTSSKSISHSIAQSLATGYYAYAVRCRLKDIKVAYTIKSYDYKGNLVGTATGTNYGTNIDTKDSASPFYYAWILSTSVGTRNYLI